VDCHSQQLFEYDVRRRLFAVVSAALLVGLGGIVGPGVAAPAVDRAKAGSVDDVVSGLIVRFSPEKGPVPFAANARTNVIASATLALGAGVSHQRVLATGADLVRLDRTVSRAEADAMAAAVSRLPGVRYAVPNRLIRTQVLPTDPLFNDIGQSLVSGQ
jgi:hypothetical protein